MAVYEAWYVDEVIGKVCSDCGQRVIRVGAVELCKCLDKIQINGSIPKDSKIIAILKRRFGGNNGKTTRRIA